MLLYAIVFATGLAGMLHAPWWAAVVGGCVLALYLINEYSADDVVVPGIDTATWSTATAASSCLTSLVATILAFAAGRFIDWLWI